MGSGQHKGADRRGVSRRTGDLRSDFVAAHDKRDLAAPGVDKGRPAGVDGQIFSVAGAHPQRCVFKRLPSELKD